MWLKLVHATFLTEVRNNIGRSEALVNECWSKAPSLTERCASLLACSTLALTLSFSPTSSPSLFLSLCNTPFT